MRATLVVAIGFGASACLVTIDDSRTNEAAVTPDAGATYADRIRASAPSVYYTFDEPVGSGFARDASGHGLDATYGTDVSLAQPGLVAGGTAARFDGIDGLSHVVRRAADPLLEPAQTLTIECWVRVTSGPANAGRRLISYGATNAVPYQPYALQIGANAGQPGGDKLRFYMAKREAFFDSTVAVAPEMTTYVAVTYDGHVVRFVIDGQPAGTSAFENVIGNYGADGLGVGGAYDGTGGGAAVIDELAIYPRALDIAELAAHFEAGRPL